MNEAPGGSRLNGYRPHIDTALLQNVRKYHYSHYLDLEKFAEIYWLFSREVVANGSLEKFAETLPKKRGKAVQRGLFPGAYLLVSMRHWLASLLAKEKPALFRRLPEDFKVGRPMPLASELAPPNKRSRKERADRMVHGWELLLP